MIILKADICLKVDDFDLITLAYTIQQDVFGLDIVVKQFHSVAVADGLQYLIHDMANFPLTEHGSFLYDIEQLATGAQL